jgi:hypothetical protein
MYFQMSISWEFDIGDGALSFLQCTVSRRLEDSHW